MYSRFHSNYSAAGVRYRVKAHPDELILEEFGPELIYTKGSTNIVADALCRLNTTPTTNESIAEAKNFVYIREANAVLCGMEKRQVSVPHFDSTTFPLTFSKIRNAQRSDAALHCYSQMTPTH